MSAICVPLFHASKLCQLPNTVQSLHLTSEACLSIHPVLSEISEYVQMTAHVEYAFRKGGSQWWNKPKVQISDLARRQILTPKYGASMCRIFVLNRLDRSHLEYLKNENSRF